VTIVEFLKHSGCGSTGRPPEHALSARPIIARTFLDFDEVKP
jgi:hypothetical protein